MPSLHTFIDEARRWIEAICSAVPGTTGELVRRRYFRWRGGIGEGIGIGRNVSIDGWENIHCGRDVRINSTAVIEAVNGRLSMGNRCGFNHFTMIIANHGEIELGDNVIVGMGSVIRAANHGTADVPEVPIRDQAHEPGKVVIEQNVWIGANVTILPNVRIGAHSVVAAGAVVNRDVPPFSIVGGVPARVIGRTGPGGHMPSTNGDETKPE